jgi:transcriptional regulator with XRE-family HTH domain
MGELRAFKRPDVEPLWREAVGETLRRRRSDAGLRLADVAKRAGVSPQYLSEVERGCKDASSEVLAAVAGALDLTVLQLATMTVASASTPATARGGAEAMCLAA